MNKNIKMSKIEMVKKIVAIMLVITLLPVNGFTINDIRRIVKVYGAESSDGLTDKNAIENIQSEKSTETKDENVSNQLGELVVDKEYKLTKNMEATSIEIKNKGVLDLNGYELKVTGDVNISGTIRFNKGRLICENISFYDGAYV